MPFHRPLVSPQTPQRSLLTHCGVFAFAMVAAAALSLSTAEQAQAQVPIDLGVAAVGYYGGSFLDEPDDKLITVGGGQAEAVYPGFAGFGDLGGGLTLDFRAFGIVGLETGVIFANHEASGEINDVDITIKQSALHIPLLLKLVVPTAVVRPNFFFGVEFVLPQDASATASRPIFPDGLTANADPYTMLAFGFGLEFALPIVGVDLRIPLAIRGGYNIDDSGELEDRVSFGLDGFTVRSAEFNAAYQWHASVTLGLAYYFL